MATFDDQQTVVVEEEQVRCQHTFVQQMLTKPVPTYCQYCSKLIWVFQGTAQFCNKCKVWFHSTCFEEVLRNKEAMLADVGAGLLPADESGGLAGGDGSSGTKGTATSDAIVVSAPPAEKVSSPGQVHQHKLAWRTYFLPTFCSVCSKLMTGFRKQGLECAECEFHVHEECIPAGSAVLSVGTATSPQSEQPSSEEQAAVSAAPSETKDATALVASRSTTGSARSDLYHKVIETNPLVRKKSVPVMWALLKAKAAGGLAWIEEFAEDHVGPIVTGTAADRQRSPGDDAEEECNEKELAELAKSAQDVALSNTYHMLQVFNSRNHRWAQSALNPLSMLGLYKRHGEIYTQACSRMPDAGLSPPHLLRIRDVLRYATAAYGQAYAQGYFQSCFGSLVLRIGRRDLLVPKPETNSQAVCNVLGVPRTALHYASWSGEIFEPNFYIVLDIAVKKVVLCFRGSLSDADFLTDACGELTPFCNGLGHAHRGISQMVQRVFDNQDAMDTLRNLLTAHRDFDFVVSGHSLGAALTCLFVAKAIHEEIFSKDGLQVPHGYAFAPPPTITMPLAADFDEHITAVVAAKDIVCRLQYNSFDRLGLEISSFGGKSPTNTKNNKGDGDAAATDDDDDSLILGELTEELHIPGKVYLLTKPTNYATRLVAVPRTNLLLHQIFLSKYMVLNHHMHNYDRGLTAVYDSTMAAQTISMPMMMANEDENEKDVAVDGELPRDELTQQRLAPDSSPAREHMDTMTTTDTETDGTVNPFEDDEERDHSLILFEVEDTDHSFAASSEPS